MIYRTKTIHIFTFRDTFFKIVEVSSTEGPRLLLQDDCEGEHPLSSDDLSEVRQACKSLLDEHTRWAEAIVGGEVEP